MRKLPENKIWGAALVAISMVGMFSVVQAPYDHYLFYNYYYYGPNYVSLTIATTAGGTTDPSPGTYSYLPGSAVPITAIANGGYRFDRWETVGSVSVANQSNPSTSVTVNGNGTVTAFFKKVAYTMSLGSRQDNYGTSNLGTMVVDGVSYSLPSWASKTSGAYSIRYNAASGYEFDHWEKTGGLNVTSPGVQSTSVTVIGNGNLTAVYKELVAKYTIYFASREDNGTASNLGIIQFDNQYFQLPNDATEPSDVYLIDYIPASGHIFLRWDTSNNITAANASSHQTSVMISGTGTITAVFTKYAPVLPTISDVKAFYTMDSFFLGGMSELVPPNQYFVRGNNTSAAEFTIYIDSTKQTYLDLTPDPDGWFSSSPIDMSEVTSNLTITTYSLTGDSSNLMVATRVYETPYWLESLIGVAQEEGQLTIAVNTTQPLARFDNVWSISLSYNWPENPIDAIYDIGVPGPLGGKYGITCGFSFMIGLQSNGKPVVGGGGGFQFCIADAEAKVGIYVTGTIEIQDGIKLENLAIRASGSIQIPFSHKYGWNGIGIEVGIYVGASVSFTLYLREASDGNGTFGYGLDWVGTKADVALWVGAYAQAGIWMGEVRVEGEGKVTFTFHVPEPYFTYPDDLLVEARITLILKCWGVEAWRMDIFSYSSHSPVQWKLESSETGWIPRTWANGNYSLYKWVADRTEGTYLEDVYLYANPSVDASSNKTIMVWTHDDLSKPYIQGYEVYYATWDEKTGNWSFPAAVTNDTIPESDAVVKFDSNGNAVAVWTQVNNPSLNDTVDPFSLLKDVELAYATWNPATKTWSQPKQITNNQAFEYSPTLISDENGNLMLVWMVDEDGNVSTYNDEFVYSSMWNGSAWSNPTRVANPGFMASPVSGAYHQGKALLTWSQDLDNNATTLSDIEVFQSEFNGTVWSVPARLTNNTFEDATPSVAFWNGQPVFTWVERKENQSDALMFLNPYEKNVSTLILKKDKILSPTLKVDPQNQILAVWTDNPLSYSGTFTTDGKIKLAEMFKEENSNESNIYYGTYDYAAGIVDVNYDGKVNILDITIVAKAFGAKVGDSAWNPDADLEGNGIINIVDIAKVARQFQKTFSDHIHCRRIMG